MTTLQSLPVATLERAKAQLVEAFDPRDSEDMETVGVVAVFLVQIQSELDRRAAAIPSDVRRRENLKAACSSAEALLGALYNRWAGTFDREARVKIERIRRNLETAIADDDRVANGGEFKL